MDNNFVTQYECEDRRKEVIDMVKKNSEDILDLKICMAEIKTTMHATTGILKAIFAVVAPGIVSIIVILMTRGL